jgi:hypothetical protein
MHMRASSVQLQLRSAPRVCECMQGLRMQPSTLLAAVLVVAGLPLLLLWNTQACQDSLAEARRDADGLSARHTQLRRRCRQLYIGYRGLRYKMEDEWPSGTGVYLGGA